MQPGDGLWAIGDVTGIWPLTYVGKYQGRVAAANILGARRARRTTTPSRASCSPTRRRPRSARPRAAHRDRLAGRGRRAPSTYTRALRGAAGFLTLVSDGERLTGAHALGPEAGEWLQQATLAIRARVPLDVLSDTIQPFPTFSESFVAALAGLRAGVPAVA